MSRLEAAVALVRVDHREPRDARPELSLTWSNFVLSCRGGERRGGVDAEPPLPEYAGEHHCDKSKGEQAIGLNPMIPSIESMLRYSVTGRIGRPGGGPNDADPDLDDALHLNAAHLARSRKRVLDELAD